MFSFNNRFALVQWDSKRPLADSNQLMEQISSDFGNDLGRDNNNPITSASGEIKK